jgi:hypothetical protein
MVDVIETPSRIRVIATVRQRASITAVNIETVIYMAAKVPGAVKPRAGADEDPTAEPFRAVVAVGSTGVRSVVVVAVRACGFDSDVDADPSLCCWSGHRKGNYYNSNREGTIESVHDYSSLLSGHGEVNIRPPDHASIAETAAASYSCNYE